MKQTDESQKLNAPAPRQRAMRADVHIAHEALKVTAPANEQIGPWQRRAAWLAALALRRQARGQRDAKIAAEACDLLVAVEERRRTLLGSISSLPAEVAESSRLDDTVKALDSITAVLKQAIERSGTA